MIILGNWWYMNFFKKGLILLENDKNWISFVVNVLPKRIKIKSPVEIKAVCAAEWLRLRV